MYATSEFLIVVIQWRCFLSARGGDYFSAKCLKLGCEKNVICGFSRPNGLGGTLWEGWTGSEQILPQGGEVIQGFSIKMLIETPFQDVVSWHVAFPCCGFYIVTSLNYWPWDMCAIYFHRDVVALILSHWQVEHRWQLGLPFVDFEGWTPWMLFWVDDLWNFKWHGNGILCFQIWQFTSFTFATL